MLELYNNHKIGKYNLYIDEQEIIIGDDYIITNTNTMEIIIQTFKKRIRLQKLNHILDIKEDNNILIIEKIRNIWQKKD